MKFDSIKSRLFLMLVICVAGMALLVISQHVFTQKLISLHQQRESLLRLQNDLLQMRRHEKDFLMRHQIDYYHRFTERADNFSRQLTQVVPLIDSYKLTGVQAGHLVGSMNNYQQRFQQVMQLQSRIGLTKSVGLKGKLAHIEQQLEGALTTNSSFTEARLMAREFLLFHEPASSRRFYQLIKRLKRDTNASEQQALLDEYRLTFTALVSSVKTMGLTHNDGLRGQFREQAHELESLLNHIESALRPAIIKQTEQVKLYSLAIALVTSVALILLLVKSFATFHNAFANFVMFFYRSKRQYQRIDPKQLGFAEFKSLAELANEMVESRRNTEVQLAATRAALNRESEPSRQPGNLDITTGE